MTKVIAALIIILVLFGGWHLFLYWDKVRNEEQTAQKQAAAAVIDPRQLSGMPYQLQSTLEAAEKQGAPGFKNFLRTYDRSLQDPRKAWIELDYIVLLARDDPAEAKRLFALVKDRTSPASPVWPRIKQLEKTYE
jgi:hypothetical protein